MTKIQFEECGQSFIPSKTKKLNIGNEKLTHTYSANRGKEFLVLPLGIIKKDAEPEKEELLQIMGEFGWYRADDLLEYIPKKTLRAAIDKLSSKLIKQIEIAYT